MRNPFTEISRTAPFVLPGDRAALDEFDQCYREKSECRINRERMP